MRLRVDSSTYQFLVVREAEPKRQYEEGKRREERAPKVDANGEILWEVQLVVMGDGDADIVRVSVPGDPKVGQGEMVRVEELTAQPWEMDGRSGMSFRASAVQPVQARQGEKATA